MESFSELFGGYEVRGEAAVGAGMEAEAGESGRSAEGEGRAGEDRNRRHELRPDHLCRKHGKVAVRVWRRLFPEW